MENNELVLERIIHTEADAYAEVAFDVRWGDKTVTLWYRVSPKYGQYLCDDRADSFIVTFLPFAMKNNLKLNSRYPVSEKLWFQLTTQVMPQLAVTSNGIGQEISIIADTTNQTYTEAHGVGTGMSCGVDSFATLYEYTVLCKKPEYKLTHLTHFNVGAHHGQTGSFNPELQRSLYQKDVAMVQRFCDEYGYELLAVDSNLTEVIDKLFGYMEFDVFHTYINAGTVLLLQKLFSRYFYSPAINLDMFHCSLKEDPAYYEKWLLPNLSTETTSFYNSNKSWTREEKLKQIVNFPQSYKWLKVCVKSDTNCCKCVKCMRTIMGLEAIGKTNLYEQVFNPDIVRANRENLKTYMLCKMKKGDSFYSEIYNEAARNGMQFSLRSRVYSSIYILLRKLIPRVLFARLKKRELNETLHVDVNEQFSDAYIARKKAARKK